LQYQFKKETIDERLKEINKVSKIVSPIRLTKNTMLAVYQELRNHITHEAFEEIEKGLKEPKQNLEANFSLAFRMMIAITIYFFSLPQFGWLLYLTAMFVLIGGMYILMISYRFLDIIPTLMRKFHHQAEDYLRLPTHRCKHICKPRKAQAQTKACKCGVKCLNSSAVFQINFSAGLTVLCPEIPHERQAQKR
jgi:hypothetical protein